MTLPIYEIIPKLKKELSSNHNLVLQAPPGAGKTTAVPLELLSEKWLEGKKIIMLEPRRLAARASARRMAKMLGEKLGETVGYRVRMDRKIGPKTRIEVVTEGVLIRKIQSDPELADVGLLIFDEFHERSVEADLGLALSLDIQAGLRDDLKVMVMSATLDGEKVSDLMGKAPIVTSEGRSFEVKHHYLDKKMTGKIEEEMASMILNSLRTEEGSILAFLPGAREIERTKKILEQNNLEEGVIVCPLYGMLTFKDQDFAIRPAPDGIRKVVLSTDIAQTSLTIEGIRIVIDSGLQRSAVYDVKSGMTGLVTTMLSKASADQRAGRAGRLEEGICFHLWSEAANRALMPFDEPEIRKVDLTPLALDLAQWGIDDAAALHWLDLPDPAAMERARDLLHSLGALDHQRRITEHGKVMAQFPMSPRLAHMILIAKNSGHGLLSLFIAALLQERDILSLRDDLRTVDLRLRVEALMHVKEGQLKAAKLLGCNISRAKSILRQIGIWQKNHHISNQVLEIKKTGLCLAIAFPDRIGGLRGEKLSRYMLSGGRGAKILDNDPLSREKYLAIADLDKGDRDARIFTAAPIEKEELTAMFEELIKSEQTVEWDSQNQNVKTVVKVLLGKLAIDTSKIVNPDEDEVRRAMLVGIGKMGIDVLPWDKKSLNLRKRVALIREVSKRDFPDFSDEHLTATLEDWLGDYLGTITSKSALKKLDLYTLLKNNLSWNQLQDMERLTPTHYEVPSGSKIVLNYDKEPPVLAVKLQELFGAVSTPTILEGKMDLSVHLLSPAGRPLQITSDLAGFWQNSYPEIKKEMKGRYPKHPWPDDPLEAIPTRKLKPRKR